jgi:hypothetical protein
VRLVVRLWDVIGTRDQLTIGAVKSHLGVLTMARMSLELSKADIITHVSIRARRRSCLAREIRTIDVECVRHAPLNKHSCHHDADNFGLDARLVHAVTPD